MIIVLTTRFFSPWCPQSAADWWSPPRRSSPSRSRNRTLRSGSWRRWLVSNSPRDWLMWAKLTFSVKHETRIRTLETKNKEQEKMLVSKGILLNNNGHNDLDPDEVWGEVNIIIKTSVHLAGMKLTPLLVARSIRTFKSWLKHKIYFQKVTIQANMSVL